VQGFMQVISETPRRTPAPAQSRHPEHRRRLRR
jgi:hypothetical protein